MTIAFDDEQHPGPLFFPVTPFTADELDAGALQHHIASRLACHPAGVFVACGTGEFTSLGLGEYAHAVRAAVEVVNGTVPVIAGAGYGSELCREFLQRAERGGADGVLVFPPPSTSYAQQGLIEHYQAVARATSLPVILYQRDHIRFTPATALALAETENIVGLKDGSGDLDSMQRVIGAVGGRWTYFNGTPTAELLAQAYAGIGVTRYSSASFAFVPEVAVRFKQALDAGDLLEVKRLLAEFYLPLAELRDAGRGYAISLIKAGLRLRGQKVGSVRPPLADPTAEHEAQLLKLINRGLASLATG